MDDINTRFIEIYKEIGRSHGIDESVTAIFARIYIEPGDVAMEDIAKETGYSLASISNKVKFLSAFWPIKKIRKPGSNKIYLHIDKDIVKVWKESMVKKEEALFRVVKDKVPLLIKDFKDKSKSSDDKKKLDIIKNYYHQTLMVENAVNDMVKSLDKIK
jgi:DNA-binding transcriptional regulator GbsR (MarR family)